MTVDFQSGITVVDTIDVTIQQGGQLTSLFLEAMAPFDGIDLSIDNGFVIDNLTVEAADVPLPATLPLFILGLVALGLARRRRG
ncbi:MAG: PEP-CTERM sorting domain-containing protein [Pseudomonadota bacterium]